MDKIDILQIVRDSRDRGTSSPFVDVSDREAEIDKSLEQLESCLFSPFSVDVVSAYYPQEDCEFINKPGVIAIAEANGEYLLYSIRAKLFAKAWKTGENQYTILGFSTDDVIAEWRG